MQWMWKAFDYLIVVGAVLVGVLVWFIPSVDGSKEMQDLYKAANERVAEIKAIKEAEARIEKEREELGIVYLPLAPLPPEEPAQ